MSNLLNQIKRIWTSSVARQLILGIALVHAVLMTIFVFDLVSRQREFMLEQHYLQASGLAETLAANGTSWVLSNDVIGIEEVINSQSSFPGLRYAMFLDLEGKVLGYTDRSKVGLYVTDSVSKQLINAPGQSIKLVETNSLIDVAAPIKVKDRQIGWARVGLSRYEITHSLNVVTTNGLIYTAAAIFIGILFAQFMAKGLTSGIRQLTQALQKVIAGERNVQCTLDRHDELQELSQDFNKMLTTINDREQRVILTHDALKFSESRYRRLVENVTSDYFFYTYNPDNIITYVSPSIVEVLGYTQDEYKGPYNQYLTRNKINESAGQSVPDSKQGDKQPVHNLEIYHKDKTLHYLEVIEVPVVDEQGKVISIEGFAHDITQIKKSEQALLEGTKRLSRERSLLRSLIDSVPDLIFYKDKESIYLGCNKAFEKFVNLPEEKIIGKTDFDMFPEDVAAFFRNMDIKMLETKETRENEEWVTYPDGHRVLLSTLKTPYYGPDGETLGLIGISRDITEQKQKDEYLNRSQKMDALGKLTGGIAHDYNNMLGVIMGFAELLEVSLQSDKKLLQYAKEIGKAGKRGAVLTKKLLAFTRRQGDHAEVAYINELIEGDKQLLEKTLTASIKVNLCLDEGVWPVYLDKGAFQDVIINMAINAMHAMPDGGEFTISTHNVSFKNHEADNFHLKKGDYVLISITDTGIGMDDETRAKIFDPFFTTKGELGTGLGLSQVYGFVDSLSGSIYVHSALGEGTSFKFYLPRHQGTMTEIQQDEVEDDSSLSGVERILVVDDEYSLRCLAQNILESSGYTVYKAEDANSALKVLAEQDIDLMLSDIIMPGLSGYELASAVQEKYPHIRILLASGFDDGRYKHMINPELHTNLLQKPYNRRGLLNKIRDLLDE